MCRHPLVACLLAAGLIAAGCGRGEDRSDVRAVAESFYRAIEGRDGERACEALSAATRKALEEQERESCAKAILDPQLEFKAERVRHVEVVLTDAEVQLAGGDRVFLGKGPDGWSISAAGCRPAAAPDEPYECEVET